MKYSIVLLLIFFGLPCMRAQMKKMETLIYVENGEKIGFIDVDGQVVIPVEFDAVQSFSEGMIAVNKGASKTNYLPSGGKWGFWSMDGREIVGLEYEDAKNFRDGLVPVMKNGKYGFINMQGQVEIEFRYEDAMPFYENLAAVQLEGKWGFINKSGDLVIPPAYHRVSEFNNGFAIVFHLVSESEYEMDGMVYKEESGRYGLIDRFGELKLDTVYENIENFVNGFALVTLNGKKGYINSKGEISIPIQFDEAKPFSEGLAVVANNMMRDSHYNFGYSQEQIDSLEKELLQLYSRNGKNMVDLDLYTHPLFREYEKAKMQRPSERLIYGYINEDGEVVIEFQYENADAFNNGLAKVAFGNLPPSRWVMYDQNGNEIPSIEEQLGLGFNLIDAQGKLQLEKNMSYLHWYEDSICVTMNHNGAHALNASLEEIFPDKYQSLSYLGGGFFLGDLRSGEKVLLGKEFEIGLGKNVFRIYKVVGNRFLVGYRVEKGNNQNEIKFGIINEKGEQIMAPTYDTATPSYSW